MPNKTRCHECGCTAFREERAHSSDGIGCLLMFVGFIFGTFIIGIPMFAYGLYLAIRKDFALRCAQCGRVIKRWQGMSQADTIIVIVSGVLFAIACFWFLSTVFTSLGEALNEWADTLE